MIKDWIAEYNPNWDVVQQTGFKTNKPIKIKIEVDRQPPLHFRTEEKLLLRPFSFYVNCYSRPSLFAGKLHALLYRKWNTRVKGRDWYDFEWYVKKGIALDLDLFLNRAKASKDWDAELISVEQIKDLLRQKIDAVSFTNIKEDIVRFIKDEEVLAIWSASYFKDLVDKMKFEELLK